MALDELVLEANAAAKAVEVLTKAGETVDGVFVRVSSRSPLKRSSLSWTTPLTIYFLSNGLGFVASKSASWSCKIGLAMMRISLNRNRNLSLTVFAFTTCKRHSGLHPEIKQIAASRIMRDSQVGLYRDTHDDPHDAPQHLNA